MASQSTISTDSIEKEKLESPTSSDDGNKQEDTKAAAEERGNWSGKLDFFMSCLSYAVGLGNLWRFPYLCYKNGGGAFIIPYTLMMIFAGMPLFFLELAFGQFAGKGILHIWQASPLFTGIGYAMFLVSACVGIYYNMVIAWAFYYTFASFARDVPWKTCQNPWNSEACSEPSQFKACKVMNGTSYNQTCWTMEENGNETYQHYVGEVEKYGRRSASYEYFHYKVLRITDNIDNMGLPQWDLALCLLLAWILIYLCLVRGIKSSGKAVYFTAIFPYLVLIVLLGRAVTLDGAMKGIKFYVTPKWELLASASVWGDAAVQIFFSLSPCWGGLITLASYNKFHNNALRDAVLVTLLNCGTSIFAGFVIFAIIGFMADQLSLEVEDVAVKGAGLAFVAYPEVVAQLPISPLWSVLFFLMLITLGLGSQLTIVNTVYTTILDRFSTQLRVGHRPKFVLAAICLVSFILGLSLTCPGGMYMLQLLDNYSATYTTLLIGLIECIALLYVYGWERFSFDIKLMIGSRPNMWWRVMWQGVTPLILVFILIFTFVDFERTTYDKVTLPVWADAIGWLLCVFCLLPIPAYALFMILTNNKGSFLQTLRFVSSPSPAWGPADSQATPTYTQATPTYKADVEMEEVSDKVIARSRSASDEEVPLKIDEPDV